MDYGTEFVMVFDKESSRQELDQLQQTARRQNKKTLGNKDSGGARAKRTNSAKNTSTNGWNENNTDNIGNSYDDKWNSHVQLPKEELQSGAHLTFPAAVHVQEKSGERVVKRPKTYLVVLFCFAVGDVIGIIF